MKRMLLFLLILALLTGFLPVCASAAQTEIRLGGKIGFMYEDMSITLKPKLKNLSMDELVWQSSDRGIVTVDGGRFTARAVGRAIITVSGGGASARCGVVVLPRKIELKAGECYRLPYGTVERYAVQHSAIASVSSKGTIRALSAGTTCVGVYYGKQKLYIQVKVTGGGTDMKQSAAAELDCADSSSQIVLVEHAGGSKARLSVHEKKSGVWTELYATTAYIGRNGIGKEREGDGRTPIGTFNLTQPFGIKADPGAKIDYTQVTKYHYWCGSSGSKYYNQLVDMREVDRKYTSSDEYLINYKGVYNYCMFIDYNKIGAPGKGSCIFLHCTGNKKSTAGCIAIPEGAMKKIIQWAKPGAKIVIR